MNQAVIQAKEELIDFYQSSSRTSNSFYELECVLVERLLNIIEDDDAKATPSLEALASDEHFMDIISNNLRQPIYAVNAMLWRASLRLCCYIYPSFCELGYPTVDQMNDICLACRDILESGESSDPTLCLDIVTMFAKAGVFEISRSTCTLQILEYLPALFSSILSPSSPNDLISSLSELLGKGLRQLTGNILTVVHNTLTSVITCPPHTDPTDLIELSTLDDLLPIGGRGGILEVLLAHPALSKLPIVVLTMLKCGAALCGIPLYHYSASTTFAHPSSNPSSNRSSSNINSAQAIVSIINGVFNQQHALTAALLNQLQVLHHTYPDPFQFTPRSEFILALAPMCLHGDYALSCAARKLTQQLAASSAEPLSITSYFTADKNYDSLVSFREIFRDDREGNTLANFVSGVKMFVADTDVFLIKQPSAINTWSHAMVFGHLNEWIAFLLENASLTEGKYESITPTRLQVVNTAIADILQSLPALLVPFVDIKFIAQLKAWIWKLPQGQQRQQLIAKVTQWQATQQQAQSNRKRPLQAENMDFFGELEQEEAQYTVRYGTEQEQKRRRIYNVDDEDELQTVGKVRFPQQQPSSSSSQAPTEKHRVDVVSTKQPSQPQPNRRQLPLQYQQAPQQKLKQQRQEEEFTAWQTIFHPPQSSQQQQSLLQQASIKGSSNYKGNNKDEREWQAQLKRLKAEQEERKRKAALLAGTAQLQPSRALQQQRPQAVLRQSSFTHDDDNAATHPSATPIEVASPPRRWKFSSLFKNNNSSTSTATAVTVKEPSANDYALQKLYEDYKRQKASQASSSSSLAYHLRPFNADSLIDLAADGMYLRALRLSLSDLAPPADASNKAGGKGEQQQAQAPLNPLPARFTTDKGYVDGFEPLLEAEFKISMEEFFHGEESQTTRAEIIPVRVDEVKDRLKNDKLQEALLTLITPSANYRSDAIRKEDLIVVTNQNVSSIQCVRDVCKLGVYCLGIVVNTSHSSGSGYNSSKKATVLIRKGKLSADNSNKLVAIPITSLSTHVREWQAISSITNHELMPLAPYLLKASPVVSVNHLMSIKDDLNKKLKILHDQDVLPVHLRNLSLIGQVSTAMVDIMMEQLTPLRIDSSSLKNTDIVSTLKKIKKHALLPASCTDCAKSLEEMWKVQLRSDIDQNNIRNLKGGKVVEIPVDKTLITKPKTVTDELWINLYRRYNNSQLYAIKYVVDSFDSLQDTRVCLVQGPPGTGKTSTIIGMVSALLGRSSRFSRTVSNNDSENARLLICAPSNAAIDEILMRCYDSNNMLNEHGQPRSTPLKIVRLGESKEGASDVIQSLVLTAQVEAELRKDHLWQEKLTIQESLTNADRNLASYGPLDTVNNNQQQIVEAKVMKKRKEILTIQEQIKDLKSQRIWNERALERRRMELQLQILCDADIVGGTLSSSGRQSFLDFIIKDNVTFSTCIIDEAAQTTEPASLIPLRFGCRRLVLVGDPRQLPATVKSRAADQALLSRSLFERLEQAEHEVVMLTMQYRMHPMIRSFPSKHFYQDLLVDSPGIVREVQRALLQSQQAAAVARVENTKMDVELEEGEEAENDYDTDMQQEDEGMSAPLKRCVTTALTSRHNLSPVSFIHIAEENETPSGTSFTNPSEARAIIRFLCSLDMEIVNHEKLTFAVITPYKAQVRLIQQMLKQTAALRDWQRGCTDPRIEVNSVDGFQGREKDVVLFSAVRSQLHHRSMMAPPSTSAQAAHRGQQTIGFVADERRLNVAITRARKVLVIFGNMYTLSADTTWRSMIEALEHQGCIKK